MANHKRKEPVVRVTVGLDLSDHESLSHLANESGVSLAWMLRRAAREFLEKQKSAKRKQDQAEIVIRPN